MILLTLAKSDDRGRVKISPLMTLTIEIEREKNRGGVNEVNYR